MKNHLTFIDMFAGIGGFRSGMEQAGHKCVGWIEWDKFARQSYQAMYNTEGEFNGKDIQQVRGSDLPDSDVWCFGFPCQDVSVSGKQAGLLNGKRSGLFFEVIRLLQERIRNKETLPKTLFIENVKNLLSVDGGWGFARMQIELDQAGYDIEWSVINSAEVVPQNRERVYIVGHKRGIAYTPVFPIYREILEAKRKYNVLRDVLEQKVDEKFYLSKEKVEQLLANDKKFTFLDTGEVKIFGNTSNTGHGSGDVLKEDGVSKTLTATDYKHPVKVATEVKLVGNISHSTSFGGNPQTGRVYDDSGLSPTLNTMQGGGREPKVLVEPCLTPDRVNKRQNGRRFKNNDEPSFTVTVADRHGILLSNGKTYVIRKLTPLECWRLQGFTDEQFDKAKDAGVSDSQLYKQAGNSVTVPVMKAIAEKFT